jgi:hypothetical protein
VVNDAFDGLAGHVTLTPSAPAEMRDPAAEFPGGSLLLFDGPRAIGPVAVVRHRQGQSLGRALR